MNDRKPWWLPCAVVALAVTASAAAGQTRSVKPIDRCLGPNPSCSSGCPSSDGDGLNDAWKIAGGIDLNGDGRVDAVHDLKLRDVQPGRKDIYVQYDYQYLPDQGTSCTVTPDSPLNPGNPNFSTDCAPRQECLKNICRGHSHAPSENALQLVVDAFAAQGIALHIDPKPHAIVEAPDSIVSFETPQQLAASPECAGPGGVSFWDLKTQYFDRKKTDAYHYSVFAHYNTCDESAFTGQACLADSECQAKDPATTCDNFRCSSASHCAACLSFNVPSPAQTGLTGLSPNSYPYGGADFVVSLGPLTDQGVRINDNMNAGLFMHELGHNLTLTHGGGVNALDFERNKPNFFSVMSYNYILTGIGSTPVPGPFPTTTVNPATSYRIDYSGRTLPTLDERDLDETVGIQGPPDNTDVAIFWTNFGTCKTYAPSNGTPIDWAASPPTQPDGNCRPYSSPGPYTNMHVAADVGAVGALTLLPGSDDWHDNLHYNFQCSPEFPGFSPWRITSATAPTNTSPSAPALPQMFPSSTIGPELTFEEASRRHLIYPQKKVNISIRPGCSEASKPVAPGQPGTIAVALLGEGDLDVTEVDRSSLRFGGEPPLQASVADVNGDGFPDLVLTFDMAKVRLQRDDKLAWLSGWLRDSQELVGSDSVTIVPSMVFANQRCR